MKTMKKNIPNIIGLVCIVIIVNMINLSLTISDEISTTFDRIGYKPVVNGNDIGNHISKDNPLYKEWCEETFVNGNHIYEAYKNIAFNVEYTSEENGVDIWQTPFETIRSSNGDCEDAVFLFFSLLPPDQKNAEIVWGWVINKSNYGSVREARAHVWYQLRDKEGNRYVVEGFSKDWNGIIPMDIIEKTESRKSILTIPHATVGSLSGPLSKIDNCQTCRSLIGTVKYVNYIDGYFDSQYNSRDTHANHRHLDPEMLNYSLIVQDVIQKNISFQRYPTRSRLYSNEKKEIFNIINKLTEVLSRYNSQKKKNESDTQLNSSDLEQFYYENHFIR